MSMTAKKAASHIRGQRMILKGQLVEARRVGADTSGLENTLDALEYAEATLVGQRATGKSGFKAGVAAGFVPYADR